MRKSAALKLVDQTIDNIQKIFQKTPYCFLSEDDFKCQIYAKIQSKLGERFSIHTETSFYGESGKLSSKPDISIYVKNGIETKQNKFFWEVSPDDVVAIMEIKFFKDRSKLKESTTKDIEKLKMLLNKNPKTTGYFVVFAFPTVDMAFAEKKCKKLGIKFYCCSFLQE